MEGCTGCLGQRDFWEKEGDAPILKFNTGDWLRGHEAEAFRHAQGWLASLGIQQTKMEWDKKPMASEGARIFRADANRTYRSEPNRELMIKLLFMAQLKFGDYQQSMGYVTGLLMLFFDPPTVFKVLTVLNDHPNFLTGYWRGEATACAIDGYVAMSLLCSFGKQTIHDKLMKLGLLPETFVQKWFAGLTIHHLPYHLLVHFLDRFFACGNRYLFQFFLAFFIEFEEDIMNAASNPEANKLIRFESAPLDRLMRVVETASEQRFVDHVARADLQRMRCEGFEKNLSKRLQGANEGMWAIKEDEIVFSDEED